MRKLQHLTLMGGIITMILASCSVEKRVHQPGYHVEWHTAQKNVKPLPQRTADLASEQIVEKEKAVVLPEQEVAVEAPTTVGAEVKTAPATASKEVVAAPEEAQTTALETMANEQEKRAMTSYYPEVVPTDGVELSEKSSKKLNATVKKLTKPSGDEGKWLRWWLISWGVGLILIILAVVLISPAIYIVGAVAWLAGTVFGVIWLVNKLS